MADNPDELFDVVDNADRVVGTATRGRVHAEGLFHRAVHVLIRNSAGRVFIQQRSMQKDSAPGKWDSSASGHLDSGEDYLDCAIREVREELGIRLAQLREVGRLSASADTGNEFVRIYTGWSEGPFTLHPTEIQDGRWIEPADLTREVQLSPDSFARCFRLVWSEFLAGESRT